MDTKEFEDTRWRNRDAQAGPRQPIIADMVPRGRVLDIGCGDGLMLSLLRDRGCEVAGVDLSEEAVRKCQARGIACQVIDIGTQSIPLEMGSFDTVIMIDVLEHVYDPSVVLKKAADAAGHMLVLSVPNFSSFPARVQVMRGKVPENNGPGKGHVQWFTYEVFRKLITDAGLRIVRVDSITFWQGIPGVRNIIQWLAQKFPSFFALSWVIQAKKI